jgi:hypothetical protein
MLPQNAAETQRHKFEFIVARFRRVMLGIGASAGRASTQPTSDPFSFHPTYLLNKAEGSRVRSDVPGAEFSFSLQEAEDWLAKLGK